MEHSLIIQIAFPHLVGVMVQTNLDFSFSDTLVRKIYNDGCFTSKFMYSHSIMPMMVLFLVRFVLFGILLYHILDQCS